MNSISIIGSGNVGGGLARALSAAGRDVFVAATSVDSPRLSALGNAAPSIHVTDVADAVGASEVVILAVPFTAVEGLVDGVGAALFAGKIVIDPTNPLTGDFMGLTIGHTTSAGEVVASLLPEARVVKAFNTIMAATLDQPVMADSHLLLPVAGDHADAKATVIEIGRSLGFDAIDAGPLKNARYLEPAVELLIQLAYGQGFGADIGLSLARA